MIKWVVLISYFIFILSCFGPSQSYPTSQQIAFVSSRDGNFEIYSMDINGFNQVNLTLNAAREKYPKFSPDGSKFCLLASSLTPSPRLNVSYPCSFNFETMVDLPAPGIPVKHTTNFDTDCF